MSSTLSLLLLFLTNLRYLEGPLSERLDPSSSLVTIGVAFVALIMLVVILPMNVRRRRRHTTDKKNGEGPNGRGNGGNGPNLAL